MSTTTSVKVQLTNNLGGYNYNVWLYKQPFDPETVSVKNVFVGVLGATRVPLANPGDNVVFPVDNSFCVAASTTLAVGTGTSFGKLVTGVAYSDIVTFGSTLDETSITTGADPDEIDLVNDANSGVAMALTMTTPSGTLVAGQNCPPGFDFKVAPKSFVYLVFEISGARYVGEVLSYDVVSQKAYKVDITGKQSVTVTVSANQEGALDVQTLTSPTRAVRYEEVQMEQRISELERRLNTLILHAPSPQIVRLLLTGGAAWSAGVLYGIVAGATLKGALAKDNIQEVSYSQTLTGVKVTAKFTPKEHHLTLGDTLSLFTKDFDDVATSEHPDWKKTYSVTLDPAYH